MVIVISPGSKCTQLIVLIDDCGHRQILIHQSLLGMNHEHFIFSEYKDIGNILKVEHQSMFLTGTFIWLQAGTLSTPC